jgi:hypothetical protein
MSRTTMQVTPRMLRVSLVTANSTVSVPAALTDRK